MVSGLRKLFCCSSQLPFDPKASKKETETGVKPTQPEANLPTLLSSNRIAQEVRIRELEGKLKAAEAKADAAYKRAAELETRHIPELEVAVESNEAEEQAAAQHDAELEAALKIDPGSIVRRALLLQPVDADTSTLAFVTDGNATGKERAHLAPGFFDEEPVLPKFVPVAKDDAARCAKVETYDLPMLDESACVEMREIVEKAGKHFGAATAYLTFMDGENQYVKFQWTTDQEDKQQFLGKGMPILVQQTGAQFHPSTPQPCLYMPRKGMPCNFALKNKRCFAIRDSSLDPTFSDTVFGSAMPFYAGAPCITADGLATATLCVVDAKPRPGFSAADELRLEALAAKVSGHIDRLCLQRDQDQGRDHGRLDGAGKKTAMQTIISDAPLSDTASEELRLTNPEIVGGARQSVAAGSTVPQDAIRSGPCLPSTSTVRLPSTSTGRSEQAQTVAEALQSTTAAQEGMPKPVGSRSGQDRAAAWEAAQRLSRVRDNTQDLPAPPLAVGDVGDTPGAHQPLQGSSTVREGILRIEEPVYGIGATKTVQGISTVRSHQHTLEPMYDCSKVGEGLAGMPEPSFGIKTARKNTDSQPDPEEPASHENHDDDFDMVPDLDLLDEVQRLLSDTWRVKFTSDRYRRQGDVRVPIGARVLNILRIRHSKRSRQYRQYKQSIRDKRSLCRALTAPAACQSFGQQVAGDVDLDINEQVVFHGTKLQAVESIAQNNFSLSHAGKHAGCMFGPGIYMAQHASKSDEYAISGEGVFQGQQAMLICRAAAGHVLRVTDPADYSSAVLSGGFDSVCGDRQQVAGTFRELVFFNSEAVMPEFIVVYARVYDKENL